jgi:hypothetical protein
MRPSYQYERLINQTDIRLIKLRASSLADAVTGHDPTRTFDFIVTSIEDAPAYETVSYVWGTGAQNTPLGVGDSPRGFLSITKLLRRSLEHIASRANTGYLWIDQICIVSCSLAGLSFANVTQVLIKIAFRTRTTK